MFILEEPAYESYLSPKIIGVYSSEAKASVAYGSILMEYFEHSKETYIEMVLIPNEMKEPENTFKDKQNDLIGFYNTHVEKIITKTEPEYTQYHELLDQIDVHNNNRMTIIKNEYDRVKKKYETYEFTKDDYEKISSRIDLKYVIRPITIDTEIEYS